MKIKEASVIDNKVIDELMAECMQSAVHEVLKHIKSQSKPLEPIVWDVFDYEGNKSDYINKTEI